MNTPTIIKPTIGRKLWYWPSKSDRERGMQQMVPPSVNPPVQALDATVIYVWGDRSVNLSVTDHSGQVFCRTSITLVQPGDYHPYEGYATWMPYQQAQAEKQAEPEKRDDRVDAFRFAAMGMSGRKVDMEPIDFGLENSDYPPTFTILPDGRTTVCLLTLHNGFTVSGQSVSNTMEAFSVTTGRVLALEDAKQAASAFLACIVKERDYLKRNGFNTGVEDDYPF